MWLFDVHMQDNFSDAVIIYITVKILRIPRMLVFSEMLLKC